MACPVACPAQGGAQTPQWSLATTHPQQDIWAAILIQKEAHPGPLPRSVVAGPAGSAITGSDLSNSFHCNRQEDGGSKGQAVTMPLHGSGAICHEQPCFRGPKGCRLGPWGGTAGATATGAPKGQGCRPELPLCLPSAPCCQGCSPRVKFERSNTHTSPFFLCKSSSRRASRRGGRKLHPLFLLLQLLALLALLALLRLWCIHSTRYRVTQAAAVMQPAAIDGH